jgi:orotate phosphoribosyltransferase-like protein
MKKIVNQSYKQEEKTLSTKWDDYKGKIVVVVGKKIFSAKTGKNAQKLIKKIEKEYQKPPLVTYIPKADSLILIF